MKSTPPENKVMKKASVIAILVTTFFYLGCACFGYAAFGDDTPGNLLTGFGFYEPYWLIDFANACIILHLIGGYQVNTQCFILNLDFSSQTLILSVIESWILLFWPQKSIHFSCLHSCTRITSIFYFYFLAIKDVQSAGIRVCREVLSWQIPRQRIFEELQHTKAAIFARLWAEFLQVMFQNIICCFNNWNCIGVPIF